MFIVSFTAEDGARQTETLHSKFYLYLLMLERSEVNKFVVPRELNRANSSEIYWQQRNKASMTLDKRMV